MGAERFVTSPFAHLARTHAASAAGDALIAVALAGSLFFSADPSESRTSVFIYLMVTIAPFAVVSPLIGPVMDRIEGGRRWMIVGTAVGRVIVAGFMIRDLDSLLLFPEAFAMLVLGKGYHVAKSAVVPTTVRDEDALVQANSKLQIGSAVAGMAAGGPGLLLNRFAGAPWTVALAAVVFGAAVVLSLRIPATTVAAEPESEAESATLRSGGIRLASWSMGVMRGVVGMLTFALAFAYRSTDEGSTDYRLGVVLGASVVGALSGAVLAPRLRQRFPEERMLAGALITTAVVGLLAAYLRGLLGASIMAFAVGISAACAKLAFDAIVQRDAPRANRGRSFARFESRFQLMWVVGAIIPVGMPIVIPGVESVSPWVAYLLIMLATGGAASWYVLGLRNPTAAAVPEGDVGAEAGDTGFWGSRAPASGATTPPAGGHSTSVAPGLDPTTPFDQGESAVESPTGSAPSSNGSVGAERAHDPDPTVPFAAHDPGGGSPLFDQGPPVFDQAAPFDAGAAPVIEPAAPDSAATASPYQPPPPPPPQSSPSQLPPPPAAAPAIEPQPVDPEFEETRVNPRVPALDEPPGPIQTDGLT